METITWAYGCDKCDMFERSFQLVKLELIWRRGAEVGVGACSLAPALARARTDVRTHVRVKMNLGRRQGAIRMRNQVLSEAEARA